MFYPHCCTSMVVALPSSSGAQGVKISNCVPQVLSTKVCFIVARLALDRTSFEPFMKAHVLGQTRVNYLKSLVQIPTGTPKMHGSHSHNDCSTEFKHKLPKLWNESNSQAIFVIVSTILRLILILSIQLLYLYCLDILSIII